MFSFLFRSLGLFILSLALILAVLDITRSITASAVIMTPLADSWASASQATLLAVKQSIEANLHPFLWDPVLLFVLKIPSWIVFWFIAMVMFWLGQKRENRYGRFANR